MYISFDLEEAQVEKIALPVHQRFSLVQGLLLLEQVNQELLVTKQTGSVTYLLYVDKEQEAPILEAELSLPIQQESMLAALTDPVTNDETLDPTEVKNFLRLVNQSLPKKQRAKKNKQKTEKQVSREPNPIKNKRFLVVGMATIFGLCLLMGGFFLGQSQQAMPESKEGGINKELTALTEQVNNQNKVETFARFFLTNYYSGKTETKTRQRVLEKFVKKENLSDFLTQENRAKSMFPWAITKKNKQWTVSFIVVLVNKHDEQETKKITFNAEETMDHYLVLERPVEEEFNLTTEK